MTSRLTIKRLVTRHVGPLDVSVEAGECVVLSGASGAGKTLLLRAIADLDEHAGEVLLDGVSCADMHAHEWRGRVGLLAAESQWWGEWVGEHFKNIDDSLLQALGFNQDVMAWEVGRCSTGERQRLALLRLLENAPHVLLLDEPTASLDAENVARVEALIEKVRREQGVAVLWVTHDASQARRVGRRRFLLSQGQLAEAVAWE